MSLSRALKAIVFDFDGTLVDSNDIKWQGYRVVFDAWPGVDRWIARALDTYPSRDRHFIVSWIVKQLQHEGRIAPTEARRLTSCAVRAYSRFCFAGVRAAPDFPAVAGTLRSLSRDYRIAINSGTQQVQLRKLVRARTWGAHCELVLGAPSTKLKNLQRIGRKFGLAPGEIAFVGDSVVDADAAAQFGCSFLYASFQRRVSPRVPYDCVKQFRDLPRAISSLGN